MASNVLAKYASRTTATITLNALASSTVNAGRVSTQVDNSSTRYTALLVTVKFTLGTSPTSARGVTVFLCRGDGTDITDAVGNTDAVVAEFVNSEVIAQIGEKITAATGDVLTASFIVSDPGPYFSFGVTQNTGVALGTGNTIAYIGITNEAQ